MTTLPDSWADEPWPLDEPAITYGRPTNFSDTHESPPQVADLADEAWEYAVDHGCSMEQALVRCQQRAHHGELWSGTGSGRDLTGLLATGGVYRPSSFIQWVDPVGTQFPGSRQMLDDAKAVRETYDRLASSYSSSMDEALRVAAGDRLLADLKRDPMPRSTLDQWNPKDDHR